MSSKETPAARLDGPIAAPAGELAAARPSIADKDASGRTVSCIPRDQLRALVAHASTSERVRRAVLGSATRKAPKQAVEEMIQEASIAVMTAKWGPRVVETSKGWVLAVTARAMASYLRRGARDRRWIGRDGKAEEPIESTNMPVPTARWLIAPWLGRALVASERDQETLEILAYKARTGRDDQETAADHGLTVTALRNRVQAFRRKYEPLRKKRRLTILVLAAATLGAAAFGAWLALHGQRPGPSAAAPVADPAASAPPSTSVIVAPASAAALDPSPSSSSHRGEDDTPAAPAEKRHGAAAGRGRRKSKPQELEGLTRD